MKLLATTLLMYAGIMAYNSGRLHSPGRGYGWLWRMALAVAIGTVGLAMFGGCRIEATGRQAARIEAEAKAEGNGRPVAAVKASWEWKL